jgi:PadR family transcriptional regulator, regulatory protein PadR
MIGIQFKKGVLDLCVLALLSSKDYYGYELVEEISESIEISEGTIYPLLRRLKNDGFVTTYLKESNEGAPRKYYKLTQKGRDDYERSAKEWKTFAKNVDKLLTISKK